MPIAAATVYASVRILHICNNFNTVNILITIADSFHVDTGKGAVEGGGDMTRDYHNTCMYHDDRTCIMSYVSSRAHVRRAAGQGAKQHAPSYLTAAKLGKIN